MFVARVPLTVSSPGLMPRTIAAGCEVVGFENWPLTSREAALGMGRVVDTGNRGARDLPSGRPAGVAGAMKDLAVRIREQRRDPWALRWRTGSAQESARPAQVVAQPLSCPLCGKEAKNERGLKIHVATSHRS